MGEQNFNQRVSVLTDEEINTRAVRWQSRRTFGDARVNVLKNQQKAEPDKFISMAPLASVDYKDPSLSYVRLLKFS